MNPKYSYRFTEKWFDFINVYLTVILNLDQRIINVILCYFFTNVNIHCSIFVIKNKLILAA